MQEKKETLGAGIKILSVLNIVGAILSLVTGFLMMNSEEVTMALQVNNTDIIVGMIFSVISLIGVILILSRKLMGIYLFFGSEILLYVYNVVTAGFTLRDLSSLVLPLIFAYFIYKKRELFS